MKKSTPDEDDVPPGYDLDCFFMPGTTLLSRLKLLLPTGVANALFEESSKMQDLELAADDEKAKFERHKARAQADMTEYGLPEDDKKAEDIKKKSEAIFSRRAEFNADDVRAVLAYNHETEAK